MHTSRLWTPFYLALALMAGCSTQVSTEVARQSRGGNSLSNPPGMVDRLVMVDTPEAFSQGTLKGVKLSTSPSGVPSLQMPMDEELPQYPTEGTWTSPEVVTDFPFTEVIPSWNLQTPPNTGIYFQIRTRDAATSAWSPWLYIGYWGQTRNSKKVQSIDGARVSVDTLILRQPATAYQIQAVFQSFEPKGTVSPSLRRLAVCYSGVIADEAQRQKLLWKPQITGRWDVDLKVPYRPQGDSTKALAGQICSPTSTSMVMQHFGIDRPTIENAQAIYDLDSGIFGNWGRAVSRAGEMGLDAWIMRFRNWDQVKAMIAAGQPIICSIKARKGDFKGPHIYESTNGHLIVLRGLTPNGDPIINDPARRALGNGFVYSKEDIERVWIGHGGVGYLIHPHSAPTTQPSIAQKS